jgi:hypothetical protein
MTASSETILITTLAEYQTRFWIPVAQRLRSAGREVQLLAFDDRSAEMAEAQGIPVVNMYRTGLQDGAPVDDQSAFAARIADYGLDGTNFLFSHERVTFGIRDTAALRRRFMIYTNAMETVLDRLAAAGRHAVAVQELGGFLSVIACYYAAKKRGFRNWFIEPSFFRGRLYYTPDRFSAPDTMPVPADQVSADVRAYLDDTLRQRLHRHPRRTSIITRRRSRKSPMHDARRLVEKLWDQFALGKHQEFGHNLPACADPCHHGGRRDAAAEALSSDAGRTVRLLPPARAGRHGADASITGISRSGRDHRLPAAHHPGYAPARGEGASGPDRRDTRRPPVRTRGPLR